MRYTLCALLIFLLGCGKQTDTSESTADSLTVDTSTETEAGGDVDAWGQRLDRFMDDFAVARDGYPSISFTHSNELKSYQVHYYFEDDYLIWVDIASSEEGGIAENYLVHKDPEGVTYLHYGADLNGAFGYVGPESGEWYTVRTDGNYKPYVVVETAVSDKFEYEIEFEDVMKTVRENRDKFTLKDGSYTYVPLLKKYQGEHGAAEEKKSYEISEILFTSNLLSETKFNPDMIAGYLSVWYPLYEDASGTLYRHKVCVGDEDYIQLNVEAGNYRWEEVTLGISTVYAIKGFDESEGDAFYATIERSGSRLKKTLVKTEKDGILMIDGRTYTSEPANYDYIIVKCD